LPVVWLRPCPRRPRRRRPRRRPRRPLEEERL